jgi:mono/diheme cytochrome c family protein
MPLARSSRPAPRLARTRRSDEPSRLLAALRVSLALLALLTAGSAAAPAEDDATVGKSIKPAAADPERRAGAAFLEGYRRYQGVCSHCHGPDGVGSTFAPSLIDRPIDYDAFREVVLSGRVVGASAMRGFADDPNVAPYVDAIYAYLEARSDGVLGRGRPPDAKP